MKLNERENEISVGLFSWKRGEEKLTSTWSKMCGKRRYLFKTMNWILNVLNAENTDQVKIGRVQIQKKKKKERNC